MSDAEELAETERVLESLNETCFKLAEKVKAQHARIKELEADFELGALVRKMPPAIMLMNCVKCGWIVRDATFGVEHKEGSGFPTPEQALQAALQSEGVEQMESKD